MPLWRPRCAGRIVSLHPGQTYNPVGVAKRLAPDSVLSEAWLSMMLVCISVYAGTYTCTECYCQEALDLFGDHIVQDVLYRYTEVRHTTQWALQDRLQHLILSEAWL